MKILVNGGTGRMGKAVCKQAKQMGIETVVCDKNSWDTVDVNGVCGIIDFSNPSATDKLLKVATKNKLPLVIATTGQTASEIEKIELAAKKIPICLTANTSKGIAVLNKLCEYIYNEYKTCHAEIIEFHHKNKVDSPSGTAKIIASRLNDIREDSVGIASVRGGDEIGTHEVIFYCDNEIITVKHQALNRKLFALGAIELLEKLKNKKKGLYRESVD